MTSAAENSVMSAQLSTFDAVGLEETNRLARMMVRTDTKYLINLDQFSNLTSVIDHKYYMLEIDGVTEFSYVSCYYDDSFSCYFEHHQARRQRCKVRTREYVDSGLKYFELKLKGRRGQTRKHRIECDNTLMPCVSGELLAFVNEHYESEYHKPLPFTLRPALIVAYRRCTLVSRRGGERVTVDYGLNFGLPGTSEAIASLNNDFIIVETKTADGKGITDVALRNLGIRKIRKCSKYCVGVNLTGSVQKNNNFLPTIKLARRNLLQDVTPIQASNV